MLIVLFIFLQIILEHEEFTHKNDIFVRHNIFMDVMVALYPQTPGSVILSYCISTIIVHKLYQYTIKRVLIALAILHQFSSGAVKTFLVNKWLLLHLHLETDSVKTRLEKKSKRTIYLDCFFDIIEHTYNGFSFVFSFKYKSRWTLKQVYMYHG